jgi:hypothetical protein
MRNDNSAYATPSVDSFTDIGTDASTNMDISYVNVPTDMDNKPTLDVTVTPKHDIIGLLSGLSSTQVCVTMAARDLPEDERRSPIDVVVALDVSYSMSGSKLELCKKTLSLLLQVLYPEDRFGLITYSDNANIEIPVQKMTKANKKMCEDKVKALHPINSTNISAAIGLAYQEICQIEEPNEVQAVFLLTDGQANCGVSDTSGLIELTRNCFMNGNFTLKGTEGAEDQASSRPARNWTPFCRGSRQNQEDEKLKPKTVVVENLKGKNPITLHAFGYGSDHNSLLLRGMSEVVPGGSYYFVEDDANVANAFGDALGGILSVVAQNATVTISVPEQAKKAGVRIVDVFHDRKIERENGSFSVVVGDFYAEESRDVLLEVSCWLDT